jgi:hypothetical protein
MAFGNYRLEQKTRGVWKPVAIGLTENYAQRCAQDLMRAGFQARVCPMAPKSAYDILQADSRSSNN